MSSTGVPGDPGDENTKMCLEHLEGSGQGALDYNLCRATGLLKGLSDCWTFYLLDCWTDYLEGGRHQNSSH